MTKAKDIVKKNWSFECGKHQSSLMGWTERWQLSHVEDQLHGTHGDVETWWCSQFRLWKRTSNKLTEYIGNKIEHVGENVIQLVQTVPTQSYEDEFNIGNRCYNTPAQPEAVFMCPVNSKEVLNSEDQTTLRSGVGDWSNEELHEICTMLKECWTSAEAISKVGWIQRASVPHQRKIGLRLCERYSEETKFLWVSLIS
jgi:hypothetical protein